MSVDSEAMVRGLDTEEREGQEDREWQGRLLPFMVRFVIGLTLFFFLASLVQLAVLNGAVLRGPKINIEEHLDGLQPVEEALFVVEAYVTQRRYHHAGALLMAIIWVRYLGFVTGMILSLVGATFILGKLREDPTKAESDVKPVAAFALETTSPGILLALLGVLLIISTIVTPRAVETTDSPVYIQAVGSGGSGTTDTPAPAAAEPNPTIDPCEFLPNC